MDFMGKMNKLILKDMKKIYYPKGSLNVDWMGFPVTEDNCPSYHHIEKASSLKEKNLDTIATVDNGAYLGKRSHELLHRIEQVDKDLYECWNMLFLMINKMKVYPIDDVWQMIYLLRDKSINVDKCTKVRK